MTRLQKNFYTVGMIFFAITLFAGIVTTGLMLTVASSEGGGAALIYGILVVLSEPLLSLLFVVLVRVLGAQSDSITSEVLGLVWFGIVREVWNVVTVYVAAIFVNQMPSGNIYAVMTMRSYGQTIAGFFGCIGMVLAVAAIGMQIYEKKMTVK